MRLGAPVRGAIYGLAQIVGVPLAWMAGKWPAALLIGVASICGMGLEVLADRLREE